jgi:voltage-gated potassium channel
MIQSQGHYILCGTGFVASHLLDELRRQFTGRVVVVDQATGPLAQLKERFPDIEMIEGDATDDDVLLQADIKKATGLFSALADEKSNLFTCVTARELNPVLRIIALSGDSAASASKLMRAGANAIVSPGMLGGLRMASEVGRPIATQFLDKLMRGESDRFHILEIPILSGSGAVGKTLADLRFHEKTGICVLAVIRPTETHPFYNPGATFELKALDRLVFFGSEAEAEKVQAMSGSGSADGADKGGS